MKPLASALAKAFDIVGYYSTHADLQTLIMWREKTMSMDANATPSKAQHVSTASSPAMFDE